MAAIAIAINQFKNKFEINNLIQFSNDNSAMQVCINKARSELDNFLKKYKNESIDQPMIKIKYQREDGDFEYPWVENFDEEMPGVFSGLAMEEIDSGKIKSNQRFSFNYSNIVDWAFFENGKIKGGYTNCAFLDKMPTDEQMHLKSIGLDCSFLQKR